MLEWIVVRPLHGTGKLQVKHVTIKGENHENLSDCSWTKEYVSMSVGVLQETKCLKMMLGDGVLLLTAGQPTPAPTELWWQAVEAMKFKKV